LGPSWLIGVLNAAVAICAHKPCFSDRAMGCLQRDGECVEVWERFKARREVEIGGLRFRGSLHEEVAIGRVVSKFARSRATLSSFVTHKFLSE
jgi:hypothetical protein